MKRLIAIVGVVVAVVFAVGTQAQTKPNFSGRWVQVTPADGADRTVILMQTWSLDKAGQLVIVVSPTIDGKHQNPVTVVYAKKP